jgi:hypothetical protein
MKVKSDSHAASIKTPAATAAPAAKAPVTPAAKAPVSKSPVAKTTVAKNNVKTGSKVKPATGDQKPVVKQ